MTVQFDEDRRAVLLEILGEHWTSQVESGYLELGAALKQAKRLYAPGTILAQMDGVPPAITKSTEVAYDAAGHPDGVKRIITTTFDGKCDPFSASTLTWLLAEAPLAVRVRAKAAAGEVGKE